VLREGDMRDEGPRTVVEDDGGDDLGGIPVHEAAGLEAIPVRDRVGAGHPLTGKRVAVQWLDGTAEEEFVVRAVFGGLIQLEELGEDGRPDGQFSWLPLTSALVLREVQP
jgi:hypothetical protein